MVEAQGHDVATVQAIAVGSPDSDVLALSYQQNRILVTIDKDFGQKVFQEKLPHHGIILLRLEDESVPVRLTVLEQILLRHSDDLSDNFVVATEKRIRFATAPN